MRYELFIALRYIFSRRREEFISVVTIICIAGVALGVTTLIATLAVMSGFDSELKNRIIGSSPHIYIEKESGIDNAPDLIKRINNIEGVKGSFPYIVSQGIIQFQGRSRGIVLKSVDINNKTDASKFTPFLVKAQEADTIENGLTVGSEVASSLGLYIGDEAVIIMPALDRPHRIKITAIFKTDMYDYDANVVYASLDKLTAIFDKRFIISGIGVDCAVLAACEGVKRKIWAALGNDFIVSTWQERNRNLFSAIKLEKLAMFVILMFIVIVACFSIIGVLIMTVMEKSKDIGILKAIGVSKKGIVAIFSVQGLIIGATGVIAGLLGGAAVSFLLERFITLPREVYYIDRIPVKFQVFDSLVIVLVALIISFLATVYPAYKASKLEPIQALRYE